MKFFIPALLLFPATGLFAAAPATFDQAVKPFLAGNCLMCHNEKAHTADLNLAAFQTSADVDTKRELWERVLSRVEKGEMPPKGLPRPAQDQLDNFTHWSQEEFARLDASRKPDPGRVTARRLNKFEYNNTVRDLLAVNYKPANDFPADDSGYGFDNIGDVLSLSPVLMEKYLAAAEKIAKSVVPSDALPKATLERHKRPPNPHGLPDDYGVKHNFPAEGDYTIHVNLNGRHDPMKLVFQLDGTDAGTYEVDTDRDKSRIAEFKVHIAYGEHALAAVLTFDPTRVVPPKPAADPTAPVKKSKPEPEPSINYIEVLGPYHPLPPPPSESYARLFVCGHPLGKHTGSCARTDLANLAQRAYRRPVTKAEVDALTRFVDMAQQQGDSFEQGMRLALEAILVSPHFLFRVERDAEPANAYATHRLTDFELASRLSYFLWSSMPDAELFRVAGQNELRKPDVLTAQVKRMLADPKSNSLVENFAGQWLQLRNLNSVKPDPDKFPEFTPELRADMRKETELFFDSIVHENRSIIDFIDGKYSFLNERLAKFYGVPGVEGDQFRRVDLSAVPERSGILTQASVLTVSSYPNRTSPVIRGKYVLENILNDPPPPPPPDVPSLDDSAVGLVQSMRKQLEDHRANPVCASCHSRMDPLGFGLETYDAIGHYRTMDGKFPIDSTGTLPSGKSFTNAAEMKQILKSNSLAFAQCLTEKLMIYGLGRGVERFDKPAIQAISEKAAADGYHFDTLIQEIAKSMPFQMRRGDATEHLIGQNRTASQIHP